MARRFYLSIVYDLNGYDRDDLTSRDSLRELDELVSEFHDRNEVIAAYRSDYNINSKKGRVCIIYEDTEQKEKDLKMYGEPEKYSIEERSTLYTYAHIIPIMYSDERLMNIEACLIYLKQRLRNVEMMKAIMYDKYTEKKQVIKTNKKYIFDTGEEKDYIDNLSDYWTAIDLFLARLKNESEEEQYFYCRVLKDVCKLSVKKKKKVTNVRISKEKLKKIIEESELTPSEQIERESKDMESFYLHHDLDEVILISPNQSRPIGSERKRKK